MKYIFCFLILLLSGMLKAQGTCNILVRDSITKELIYGVKAVIKGLKIGAITNQAGLAVIKDVPNGTQTIMYSSIGYTSKENLIEIEDGGVLQLTVILAPIAQELDEVYIEATRANRTVANLPTRTEVLTEEIDEAASMEPSKIAHLTTHSN